MTNVNTTNAFKACAFFMVFCFTSQLFASEFGDEDEFGQEDTSSEVYDPWEPANRVVFATYRGMYDYGGVYITKTYMYTPSFFRERVSSFLVNLTEPVSFVNHVLQLKPNAAFETLFRFAINSTIGLFGLWDVMTALGLPQKPNDFGATAYIYGVPEGPYVIVLGPYGLRDTLGTVFNILTIDYYFPAGQVLQVGKKTTCVSYIDCTTESVKGLYIPVVGMVNILEYSVLYEEYKYYVDQSLDPYGFVRTTFISLRRNKLEAIKRYD
jgi:ABC-type transporter lipoprotein component MlaA